MAFCHTRYMQQRNRALLAHRSIVPYRRLQVLADCNTENHEPDQGEQLEQIGEDSLLGMLSGVKASDTEPATDLQNDLISPRGRMRLSLEPQHAVLLIIILMCALSLSVTLSVRQGIVLVRQAQHQEQLLAQHAMQNADNADDTDADTRAKNHQPADISRQQQNEQSQTEQVPELSHQQIEPMPQQQMTININTATAEQLQQLKGIGPTMAQRIIDYRNKHGHFSSIDELQQVKGIGVKTLAKIRDDISVGDAP